jgi:hypothetical protein
MLQDHGFVIARKKGSFNWKSGSGAGRTTEWEITTESCDGAPAKRLYKEWVKQNTAPDVGTGGARSERRLPLTRPPNDLNGSHDGYRSATFSTKNRYPSWAHIYSAIGGAPNSEARLSIPGTQKLARYAAKKIDPVFRSAN